MPNAHSIEVVSIGEELLLGQTLDTNAHWIAQQLYDAGLKCGYAQTVGDSPGDIIQALEIASGRSRFIICTGGLGPTEDDLTIETAAKYFDRKLILHEDWAQRMRQIFEALGRSYATNNEKQAYLPEGGELLFNDKGTAPGCRVGHKGGEFFFLPGVPREMKSMFAASVLPYLKSHIETPPFRLEKFRVFGIPESTLERQIQPVLDALPSEYRPFVQPAYRVQFPEIEFKLAITHPDPDTRQAIVSTFGNSLKAALGDHLVSSEGKSLARLAPEALLSAGATLTVAESCTGGLLGQLLTDEPGATAFFLGGSIAYHNKLKAEMLGVERPTLVEHGAVSAPVAQQMAQKMLMIAGSDLAISITGIAGPDGGTADKPVGTVHIGMADASGARSRAFLFRGDRGWVRNLSAYTALFSIWRYFQYDRDLEAGLGT